MRRTEAAKYRKPAYVPRISRHLAVTSSSGGTRIRYFKTVILDNASTHFTYTIASAAAANGATIPILSHILNIHQNYFATVCS